MPDRIGASVAKTNIAGPDLGNGTIVGFGAVGGSNRSDNGGRVRSDTFCRSGSNCATCIGCNTTFVVLPSGAILYSAVLRLNNFWPRSVAVIEPVAGLIAPPGAVTSGNSKVDSNPSPSRAIRTTLDL